MMATINIYTFFVNFEVITMSCDAIMHFPLQIFARTAVLLIGQVSLSVIAVLLVKL